VLVGLDFALGYPRSRPLAAGLTVVFTGALELLQLLVPDRHARLEDFLADALAALGGFAIASIIDFAMTAKCRSNPT
jgi:VanZ family protein